MKRNEIERLLPDVFRRTLHPGNPLWALLEVMEALHQPSEQVLRQVEITFSPYRTPDRFVPFLASWVDLNRFFPERGIETKQRRELDNPLSPGLGRLRELIAAAAYLSQWRGTAKGLRLFLEAATGVRGFQIDEQAGGADGMPRPFHIGIRAPRSTLRHRTLIERIIEQEKPAYVTYELDFAPLGQESE